MPHTSAYITRGIDQKLTVLPLLRSIGAFRATFGATGVPEVRALAWTQLAEWSTRQSK